MKWTGHDSETMVIHYAKAIRAEDVENEFQKAILIENLSQKLLKIVQPWGKYGEVAAQESKHAEKFRKYCK